MSGVNTHSADMSRIISGYRFSFTKERELQDGLEKMLRRHEYEYEREYIFDAENRADFFFPGTGLLIEVKVGGSTPDLIRQLWRYAHLEEVRGILVVTARVRHRNIPETINKKPVAVTTVYTNPF